MKNRAEQLVFAADRALKQTPRGDRAQLQEALKRVQKAMRGKDENELISACDQLEALLGSAGFQPPEDGAQGGAPQSGANDDGSFDAGQ